MPSVIFVFVVMLNVSSAEVEFLILLLSVVILSAVTLNVVMLSVVVRSVIMLSVVRPRVLAPHKTSGHSIFRLLENFFLLSTLKDKI
jgi:hypothetical protein